MHANAYCLMVDQYCESCHFNWFTSIHDIRELEKIDVICPECGSGKTVWSLYVKIGDRFYSVARASAPNIWRYPHDIETAHK